MQHIMFSNGIAYRSTDIRRITISFGLFSVLEFKVDPSNVSNAVLFKKQDLRAQGVVSLDSEEEDIVLSSSASSFFEFQEEIPVLSKDHKSLNADLYESIGMSDEDIDRLFKRFRKLIEVSSEINSLNARLGALKEDPSITNIMAPLPNKSTLLSFEEAASMDDENPEDSINDLNASFDKITSSINKMFRRYQGPVIEFDSVEDLLDRKGFVSDENGDRTETEVEVSPGMLENFNSKMQTYVNETLILSAF